MKQLFVKPSGTFKHSESRYEKYNLRENPFPSTPIVNQEDKDIRYNGGIFEKRIRAEEWEKFLNNFIKVAQDNPNHLRLGYILDTSYVGRGNGKSTFSINLLKEINHNYCLDISDGVNKCFGLYISPEPSGRTKNFYDLVDVLFEAICTSGIIEYCLATLRLEAIQEEYPKMDMPEFSSETEAVNTLNSFEWYTKRAIEYPLIVSRIFQKNELSGLPDVFPLSRDRNNFYGPGMVAVRDFRETFSSLKKGKERLEFVFNHMVNFFIAAGFNGCYVIVDDFERIPDFQSDRQKREFALELRTNLYDGMTKNAKVGFFDFILILHAGVPRLIEKSWSDTGMEQRSPILTASPSSSHIIFFEKLTQDHAVLLLKKYLQEYRLTPIATTDAGQLISPFEKKAAYKLAEMTELNAAAILQKAHLLLEKAADGSIDKITEHFVLDIVSQPRKIEDGSGRNPDDDSSLDLMQKARKK